MKKRKTVLAHKLNSGFKKLLPSGSDGSLQPTKSVFGASFYKNLFFNFRRNIYDN